MRRLERKFVVCDERGRVSLNGIGDHDKYEVTCDERGVLTFTPVNIVPAYRGESLVAASGVAARPVPPRRS